MSRQLGSRYVLDDVIGKGASGQVWRGHDVDGHMFAFKLLRDSIADDPDSVARFFQERKILTGLQHPNIARVRDLVAEGDTLALVMELVTGGDLRGYLKSRGTLPPDEACELTAQIADGLAAMHADGIIHRDIKPENILIDTSTGAPIPKITDFSIARIVSTAQQSTMMAGTPSYVAPELFDDKPPTIQSDLYSLGIVLYELLTGVPPFRSDSLLSMMKMHATEPPPRPPGIPGDIWLVISSLLAKDPADRQSGAAATVLALLPQGDRFEPSKTLRRPEADKPQEPAPSVEATRIRRHDDAEPTLRRANPEHPSELLDYQDGVARSQFSPAIRAAAAIFLVIFAAAIFLAIAAG
jgi:serine/threonine protein kinase